MTELYTFVHIDPSGFEVIIAIIAIIIGTGLAGRIKRPSAPYKALRETSFRMNIYMRMYYVCIGGTTYSR